MATEPATQHADPRAPDTIVARPLLIAALALGLVVFGSVVLLRWVLGSVEHGDAREHGPAVRADATAAFPVPALQADPAVDIAAYRRENAPSSSAIAGSTGAPEPSPFPSSARWSYRRSGSRLVQSNGHRHEVDACRDGPPDAGRRRVRSRSRGSCRRSNCEIR